MSRPEEPTILNQLTEIIGPNRAMAPMIVPPDGGWGWVIVFVGLVVSCFTDGLTYCFYLFREPMAQDLHIQEADISYLSSLNTGFYFVGVFACSFGNHWGFRATAVLGGIVTSISYAAGYYFNEMIYYYIVIGGITGLGCGFTTVGAGIPPSFWFDKKRSIALGIVSCGSGLGGMLCPTILEIFMKHYGWRNTYLFEAALMVLTIFLSLLIRPLTPVMVVIETPRGRDPDDSMDYTAFQLQVLNGDSVSDSLSRRWSIPGESIAPSAHPTIANLMNEEATVVDIRVRGMSRVSVVERLHNMTQCRTVTQMMPTLASTMDVRITEEPLLRKRLPWYKCGCCRSKYVTLPQRPLMRTDLYYTGNIKRLPEYNETERDLDYHLNVTKVPTYYQVVQDITKKYTFWCCYNIFTGLRYLVDYTMFKSLAFNCLALCGFSMYLAFYLPFIFCKVHLEELGAGAYASTLVSAIGLGSMIGRLLSGLILTSCPMVDARSVVSVMNFASAISLVAFVQFDDLYFKGVCLFVSGFTIGFFVPLRSLIIVDYFGLEKLTSATGVVIISVGVGSFMGPPLAEYTIKATKERDAPFYFYGVALFVAGLSLLPMKCLANWENKRAERKKAQRRRTQ